MAANVGSIAVRFGANLQPFDAGIKAGERRISTFSAHANRQAGIIERRFAGMGALIGRNFRGAFAGIGGAVGIGALAGGFGFSALIQQAKGAAKAFADMNDAIRASGVSSDLFQALEFAGVEEGVTGISKALEDFASKSGLAVVGKGRMVEALKALNPELLRNIQLAKDQDERIRLVADAVANAATAEQKAAIIKSTFGDSMLGLVRVFENGAKGLDNFTRRARELGLVVDKSILAKADELDDKLSVAAKVIDVQFKSALVELVPHIVTVSNAIAGVTRSVNRMLDSFKSLDNRQTRFLQEEAKALRGMPEPPAFTLGTGHFSPKQRLAEIEAELARRAKTEITVTPRLGSGGLTVPERSAAIDAATKQKESVAALVAEMQFESEQLRRNTQDQELYAALKAVGVERNSEFGRSIEGALSSLQRERAEIEKTAAASQALGDVLGDALSSMILRGEKAIDVAKRLALGLAEAAIKAASMKWASGLFGIGSDPWAGLRMAKGGVFNGGALTAFAKGGIVNQPTLFPFAKGAGLMGEAGPEAIMPLARTSGGKLGVMARGLDAGAASRVKVDVEVHVNDDGTLGAIARQSGAQAAGQAVAVYDRRRKKSFENGGRFG